MSLPVVPAGTNPFTVYANTIEGTFYGNPSAGFKVRLGLLFGMTSLIVVLAVVNWFLLVREAKRHGRGSPYWLFRLADRQSGRLIITNGKLVLSLFSFITGLVLIGQLVDLWQVYVNHGSQDRSSVTRTFSVLPLLLQGWLMPFASLQASLLASDHTKNTLMSARTANILFAGVGSVVFIGVVATSVVNCIAAQSVWAQASSILKQLRAGEATWTPTTNALPALLKIAPELQTLQDRFSYQRTVQLATVSIWILIPVFVIGICICGLRLSRLLHHQVQFNIDQFLGPLGSETGMLSRRSNGSTGNVHAHGAHAKEKEGGGLKFGDSLLPTAVTRGSVSGDTIKQKLRDGRLSISHLSRGDLMKLANRRGSGMDRERVKNIQSLQKAEKDLIVTSYVIMLGIGAILCICIYSLYLVAANKISSLGWGAFEATLTASIWVYDVCLLSVLLSLVWFHWTARNIKAESDHSSTYFGQPTTLGGGNHDPMMSMNSQHGQRRGTVTIDLGNGFLTQPGGGGNGTGSLSVPGGGTSSFAPEMSAISQTASKELESYAWGPRGGEEEVLKAEEEEEDGAVAVQRPHQELGSMSPRGQ